MKKYLILIVMVACLSAMTETANPTRAFQIMRHNINQVEMCISNFGKFGQDETGNNAGCWWPIGTTDTYIFGAGLWFGTIDSLTGDTLVSIGYFPYTGASEFAPGLAGMSPNDPEAIIWMYGTANWPPNPATFPMAPTSHLSHQDSWCCYNETDITYHVAGDTRPIGLEAYQTVYVWNEPAIEDVVWFIIDVKNVAGTRLKDCFISVTADCDVGTISTNDLCAGIVWKGYVIGSDTIDIDCVGYQWQTDAVPSGTIGFDLLQTPFDLVEGEDKDGDGIPDQYERDSAYYVNVLPPSMWDVDGDGVPDWRDASENPQYGMTALKQFTLNVEPQFDAARYMTLAGYDFQTGIYEPFDTVATVPDDQRFLMSSGPFDLDPDSMVTIVFAVFFADWYGIYQTPDTALVPIGETVQLYYDMYWYLYTGIGENCEFRISDFEMRVMPNPVTGRGVISYSVPRPTYVSLKLYNVAGQLTRNLLEEHVGTGHHTLNLRTQGLPHGMYFLVLETPEESKSQPLIVTR